MNRLAKEPDFHHPILGWLLIFMMLPIGLIEGQEQPAEILPLDDYWQLVQDTHEAIGALVGATPEATSFELAEWANRWAAVTAVELSDGTVIPLDTSFLVSRLRDPEVTPAELESLFLALQKSGQSWSEPTYGRQSLLPLDEILSRPEFFWPEEEPTFFDRIWEQILEQLLRLLARILPSAASGLGPIVQTALTIAGIVILLGVLVFTFRGLLTDLVSEADTTSDGELGDEKLNADQALRRAQNSSTSGDYRSAVRYLYLSSLLLLEERDLIRYDRSQTNQEYLRSVAGRPELAVILQDVIDVFDRVWYGFQSLDSRAYAQYQARVEQLRRQK
jgi:hypothetical protein